MQEGDKAEHGSHTAPFIGGEALFEGNTRDLAYNVVHGSPLRLDANDLQEGKVNGEFTRKPVEITAGDRALGLKCRNLER